MNLRNISCRATGKSMGVNQLSTKHQFDDPVSTQEAQYTFPYHYIPMWNGTTFSQHLYWSWGYRYMGGLKLVLDLLADVPFQSLLDIGCGDGRLLREIDRRFGGKRLKGVDVSERAIGFARALNPGLDYARVDFSKEQPVQDVYDVITMIDVLEHVHPEHVEAFVSNASRFNRRGGLVIVMVPHSNISLTSKHYQHFDSESVRLALEPFYAIDNFVFFEKRSWVQSVVMARVLANSFFILNNRVILGLLFRFYLKYFFLCKESQCGRICAIGHRK